MAQTYVRYHDGVERKLPGEDRIILDIVAAFGHIARTSADHYRHAVRPSHAKSHGLLKGTLDIRADLPEPYAQGLFRTPRSYPLVVRFASVPGDILPDAVHTQRGMTLKVIGVEDEKIAGHESEVTQDFLLDDGTPNFPDPDLAAFAKTIKGLAATTERLENVKKVVSAGARGANAILKKVGLDKKPVLDFLGHPPKHILGATFFSQAPIRYGDYIAKVSVAPSSESVKALADLEMNVRGSFSAVRDAIVDFFEVNGAEYDLCIQLCTDLQAMPVEDASIAWPEDESPYVPVARIILPPQAAYSAARRVYVDDVLSFSPAHSLAAHRPLGSIMRGRLKAYGLSSEYRHEHNAQPRKEPRSIEEIPD